VNSHPFMYQEYAGRANPRQLLRTTEEAASCLKSSGQWSVVSGQ
jgi:hypothetical protein